jgi:hypothetical protein
MLTPLQQYDPQIECPRCRRHTVVRHGERGRFTAISTVFAEPAFQLLDLRFQAVETCQ